MIGRYQIYVMNVIAQLVPAGRTIFPMIGRYQIYMINVIAQLVPAGPTVRDRQSRQKTLVIYFHSKCTKNILLFFAKI